MKDKAVKKLLLIIASLVQMITLVGCGETTVDVKQIIDVSYDGLQGYGTATVKQDTDAIDKILEGSKLDKSQLVECLTVDVVNGTDLSNGDTVTVQVGVDEEKAKEYALKFINTGDIEYTVSNLQEAIVIDPFADDVFGWSDDKQVQVSIDGMQPFVTMTVNNKSSEDQDLNRVEYSLSKSSNIEVGDTVTVTASLKDPDGNDYGYALSSDTYEINIDNSMCKAYITSVDDLAAADYTAITDYIQPVVDQFLGPIDQSGTSGRNENRTLLATVAITNQTWQVYKLERIPIRPYTLTNIHIPQYTLMVAKDPQGDSAKNCVQIIYEFDYELKEHTWEPSNDTYYRADNGHGCCAFAAYNLYRDIDGQLKIQSSRVDSLNYIYKDLDEYRNNEIRAKSYLYSVQEQMLAENIPAE